MPQPPRPQAPWRRLGPALGLAALLAAGLVVIVVLGTAPAGPGATATAPLGGALGGTSSPISPGAGPWLQLSRADTAEAAWSPDGGWLLVSSGVTNGSADQQTVALLDRAGQVVRPMQGTGALWVDARTFLVFRGRETLVGSVDASRLTPIDSVMPASRLSNGRGAVAYALSPGFDSASSFAVWTPAGTSPSSRGVPVAWSSDGSRLAIWHWSRGPSGPTVVGWVEVVTWPGLRPELEIRTPPTAPFAGQVQFDLSRRHLYVNGSVVDLATGAVARIAPGFLPGDPVWSAAGQLVMPSLEGGDATRFDANGRRIGTIPAPGDSIAASADGMVLVSWDNARSSPIILLRGSAGETIPAPGPLAGILPAPDGSGLVAIAPADGGIRAFLSRP